MSRVLNRLLLRLGRWPRRIGVAVCLILAASSAVHAHNSARTRPVPGPLTHLHSGQVAVPVSLDQPSTSGLVHAGDRVGLMSGGSLLADGLLVLSVQDAASDTDQTQSILVAADRTTALHITRSSDAHILAVLDKSP